jgi:hypothetical protein
MGDLRILGKWKSGYLWYRGLSVIIPLKGHADSLQVIVAYIMELSLGIVFSIGALSYSRGQRKGFKGQFIELSVLMQTLLSSSNSLSNLRL